MSFVQNLLQKSVSLLFLVFCGINEASKAVRLFILYGLVLRHISAPLGLELHDSPFHLYVCFFILYNSHRSSILKSQNQPATRTQRIPNNFKELKDILKEKSLIDFPRLPCHRSSSEMARRSVVSSENAPDSNAEKPPATRKSTRNQSLEMKNMDKLKANHKKEIDRLMKELKNTKRKLASNTRNNDALVKSLKKMIARDKEELDVCRALLTSADNEIAQLNKMVSAQEAQHRQLNVQMMEWKKIENNEYLQMLLDTERAKAEVQRKRALECIAKMIKGQEDMEGQVKVWKICEICSGEYGVETKQVPRILDCGHTICHNCAMHLNNFGYILCPFDRKPTEMKRRGVDSLPKNFTLLQM